MVTPHVGTLYHSVKRWVSERIKVVPKLADLWYKVSMSTFDDQSMSIG